MNKNNFENSSKLIAKYRFSDIVGDSRRLQEVLNQCKNVAKTNCSIMIEGPSGSGKELLAQAIHNESLRADKPFVAVNCGAIPKNLIESELFGYEGGSFTGAKGSGAKGKFELANGGTIFLDEIGEMPIDMQVTLLRALQEREITRIGGSKPIPIDVRVISATNKDLKEQIKQGEFREDLYYRLTVFPVNLPPLKDRIGDIPILLDYFLEKKSLKLNKDIPVISEDIFKKIISYCWPGNIREFENFIENLVLLKGSPSFKIDLEECHCLTHDNLGNPIEKVNTIICPTPMENVNEEIIPLDILEKNEIIKALRICENNITSAAKALGVSRAGLYKKMKRHEIENI